MSLNADCATGWHYRVTSMNTDRSGAVDAALHEFDALRALMIARMQMQLTLLAGTLTAIGVIAGLARRAAGFAPCPGLPVL